MDTVACVFILNTDEEMQGCLAGQLRERYSPWGSWGHYSKAEQMMEIERVVLLNC